MANSSPSTVASVASSAQSMMSPSPTATITSGFNSMTSAASTMTNAYQTLTIISGTETFTSVVPNITKPPHDQGSGGQNDAHKLGGGAIAGIVVGVVIAVVAACLGAFFCYRRRRNRQRQRHLQNTSIKPDPGSINRSAHDHKNFVAAATFDYAKEVKAELKARSGTSSHPTDVNHTGADVDNVQHKDHVFKAQSPSKLNADVQQGTNGSPPAYGS